MATTDGRVDQRVIMLHEALTRSRRATRSRRSGSRSRLTRCWSDPHLDFRYFTFDIQHDALLDATLASYEVGTGRRLSRERIHLYNAACAVGYLAFRDGVRADAVWCGRTLANDLAWTRHAMARV